MHLPPALWTVGKMGAGQSLFWALSKAILLPGQRSPGQGQDSGFKGAFSDCPWAAPSGRVWAGNSRSQRMTVTL